MGAPLGGGQACAKSGLLEAHPPPTAENVRNVNPDVHHPQQEQRLHDLDVPVPDDEVHGGGGVDLPDDLAARLFHCPPPTSDSGKENMMKDEPYETDVARNFKIQELDTDEDEDEQTEPINDQ